MQDCRRVLSVAAIFETLHMRAAALGLVIAALATPIVAGPRPTHLPSFNGVALGATLESARAKLGSTFKSDGVKFQTVSGVGSINGQAYDLSYVFRKSNRLTEVYAKWYSPNGDNPSCATRYKTALQPIVAEFGKPDKLDERLQGPFPEATAEWAFPGGAGMEVQMQVYRDRCNIDIVAATKEGQSLD